MRTVKTASGGTAAQVVHSPPSEDLHDVLDHTREDRLDSRFRLTCLAAIGMGKLARKSTNPHMQAA